MVDHTDTKYDDLIEDTEDTLDEDLDLDVYATDPAINSTIEQNDEFIKEDNFENIDFDSRESLNNESTLNQNFEIDPFLKFVEKKDLVAEPKDIICQSLDEISFTVKCEIGHVAISLNELLNLKIGDCLEFMRWPGKVKLKLNDYLFAEGYLVELDGMLGVKITNNLGSINSFLLENKIPLEE